MPGARATSPIFAVISLTANPVSAARALKVSLSCSFFCIASSVADEDISVARDRMPFCLAASLKTAFKILI